MSGMDTDERRARAIMAQSAEAPAWDDAPADIRNICLFVARAIRASDEAALGLRPDQLQPDEDSPGLYIQCATTEQRRQIMAMLAAATESDNG